MPQYSKQKKKNVKLSKFLCSGDGSGAGRKGEGKRQYEISELVLAMVVVVVEDKVVVMMTRKYED